MVVNRAKGAGNIPPEEEMEKRKEKKKEGAKKNASVIGGVRRALFTAELIRRNGATRSISRYLELLPDRGPTSVPPYS